MAAQHEVTVVDRDAARCAALEERLGSVSVVGDGTEASALGKAGVNRADIFVAATARDDENIVACQLAKHHFGVSRTVSLVNMPDHERLFSLLGIDLTIDVTNLIVDRIKEAFTEIIVEQEAGGPG